MLTVEEMYKLNGITKPFLSDACTDGNIQLGDWWKNTYVQNYQSFDKYFSRCFKSFKYYAQPVRILSDVEKEEVLNNFREDVTSLLIINTERYRQLYRAITDVPDEENKLYENVNGTETTTITYGKIDTETNGKREDINESKSLPFKDTVTTQTEKATDTSITGATPFDSNTFSDKDKVTDNIGQRKQTVTTDSTAKTVTVKNSMGEQVNKNEATGKDITEYKRHGNIGVSTVSQMLSQHVDFWKQYEFLQDIFKEISKELLIV